MIYALFILFIIYFSWRLMPPKGVKSLTTKQLKQELATEDKLFVDVRTPAEFKKVRIEGFENYPLGTDLSILPKDREIILICKSGVRSIKAAKQLKKLGYERVTNVRGGITQYK
jgi:rhodanese-related sulfurtransferase